jgi:hypothetical protein
MPQLRSLERRLLRVLSRRAAPGAPNWDFLERWVFPSVDPAELDSYESEWFTDAGLDLRRDEQIERLRRWEENRPLFDRLRSDPRINPLRADEDVIRNGWYPTPDAETYASMIAERRPARIVEVGGGFSTLVARSTIEHLGLDAALIVIDPEPRTDVRDAADELILDQVEHVSASALLGEGDRTRFLFVDSSHIARTGGDVPYLFNAVIPELAPGTSIHVHDVFLPYEYPPHYQGRLYTEQYLLHALLAGSDAFRIVFAGAYLAHAAPEQMSALFGPTVPRIHGSSAFWFEVSAGT